MRAERDWRWIASLILGIGGLVVAGGLALGFGSLRYVLYGDRVDGVVTAIERNGDMYSPVVRFRVPGGTLREVKDSGSGAPDFSVGDTVDILYMPQNPESFRISTFERLWLTPLFVTGFGAFWLMFGAVAWALSRSVELFVIGERAFMAIAVAAVVIGIFTLWSATDLYASGSRAQGRVVEIRQSRSVATEDVTLADGRKVRRSVERTSLTPIVQFTTADGREFEFHGRGGSGESYAEGDAVTVVYDTINPTHARIVSFLDLWLPAAVAFLVALLFGGAASLSARSRQGRAARSQGYS